MNRIIAISFFFILCYCVAAQNIVDVCGEYTYYPSEDVSLAHAKQIAIERARIEGLIKAFNQTVYQSNTSIISNRNGESSSDFYSFGGSDARGEWIEDTKDPILNVYYEQEMLVVNTKVCGKAREIKSAGVTIISKVLRNGLTPKYESREFNSGDDMYLYFRSPVSGYVLVYLLDRSNKTVYCLLPYRNSEKGNVQVEGDKDYVFFHRDKRNEGWEEIDEYTLEATDPVEWNDIYVLFSTHPFVKASSTASDDTHIPKELPFKDFEDWLIKCMAKDHDMVVDTHRSIKIIR